MRKNKPCSFLFVIIALAIASFAVSCEKDSMQLEKVDDVCEVMDDREFQYFCRERFDSNGDGKVSMSEAAKVKVLDIDGVGSFKGIEYFTSLERLYSYGEVASLDVSKNRSLIILDLSGTKFTSLDLSNNTKLQELKCGYGRLTSLDLSKNPNLIYLYCRNNQLTSLDLSKNPALIYLDCRNNQLTSLDVSNNRNLAVLDVAQNRLTSMDLSGNNVLRSLFSFDNMIPYLDVSATRLFNFKRSDRGDDFALLRINDDNSNKNRIDMILGVSEEQLYNIIAKVRIGNETDEETLSRVYRNFKITFQVK